MEFIWMGYLLIGVLAGTLSGLLGIGGGVVIVPSLHRLFEFQGFPLQVEMQLAAGTSLSVIAIATFMAAITHHRRGGLPFGHLKRLLPTLIPGVVIGVLLADKTTTWLLQLAFGLFTLYMAHRLLVLPQAAASDYEATQTQFWALGAVTGVLSGLLGIGGGVILVPWLIRFGLTMFEASALAATCAFPMALIGAITAVFTGYHVPELPPQALGYVFLPAFALVGIGSVIMTPLAVRLAVRCPVRLLKRLFAVLLILVAFTMWYDVWVEFSHALR